MSGHAPYTSVNDVWRHFVNWARCRTSAEQLHQKKLDAIPDKKVSHQDAMDAMIRDYNEGMMQLQEEALLLDYNPNDNEH